MVATAHWGIRGFIAFSILTLFSTTTAQIEFECQQIEVTVNIEPTIISLQWTVYPCYLMYEIRHYINGVLNQTLNIPHPVSAIPLQREDCSANSIQISPLAISGFGPFDDVYANFSILWDGDTAVRNLAFNPVTRHFEWQAPVAPGNCDLEYLVEFTSDHGDYDETVLVNDEFFASPIANNIACSISHINVTTWFGRAEAYGESRNTVRTEPMAEDLQVRNLRFESIENTRFVWDPPENAYFCNVQYEVHFTNDLDPIGNPVNIRDNFLDITLIPCSDNRITVVAVAYNGDRYRSEPMGGHHRGPTPENLNVRNIRFESTDTTRFVWEPPEDSELCNITYTVRFTNEDYPVAELRDIDDNFYDIIVHPCSNNRISIITSVHNDGTYQSCPVEHAHRGPRPENLKVRNLGFEIENARFVWEAPEDSQLCNIRYIIHFRNELIPDGDTVDTEYNFFDIEVHPCSNNTISVITSVFDDGDYESEPVNYSHTGSTPENLKVRKLGFEIENARFVWEAPEDSQLCNIRYIIHFRNELIPDGDTVDTEYNFFDIEVHPCSNNTISVITSVFDDGDYESEPVNYSHTGSTPENLEVQNLRFEIENTRFAWEAPEDSQLCNIRYIIHFTNELFPERDTMDIENQFFNIVLYPCSDNRISVITSVYNDGDYESEAVPYQHVGPVTRLHPEHISTDPLETTADVVWNIVPDDPNWCTVRDFVFEVNEKDNDDAPATEFRILEYYDQVGEFRYTLTDLQNDTIYTYRTCFEFAEVMGVWYCGKSIEFPTTILRVPEIQLTTVTTSEIGFFWGNNENQDFVTGHTVYIEAIKPYHFTPAHCKSKWNMSSFVEQDLPATTESFNFEYAYPSFLYHIEVTIHFDGLGVKRTAMKDDVVTNEGVPGYLDIETSYHYIPSAPFNASLKAKWEIPCDINGAVQNFTYTLNGVLKSESVLACDVKIGSGVLDVDNKVAVDEPMFEIELPGVLPFFDYVLEIETSITKYSSLTITELDDVPLAHTGARSYRQLK